MRPRLACLRLMSLPLEALLRARPGLRTRALVVAVSDGPAAQAVAVSGPAAAAGLVPGLSLAACRRLLPAVEVERTDPELERAACEELATAAASYSPWVEVSSPGTVMLDATGVSGLFGGELGFGTALVATLAGRGLEGRLGVAGSRAAAFAAACSPAFPAAPPPGDSFAARGRVIAIEPGREAAFLAPLPLGVFAPDPDALELLADLGVRTCGELAGLARNSLEVRLGPPGLALAARARGEDPSSLILPPPEDLPRARLEFETPLADRTALLAGLGELLDRLLPGLADQGLGIDALCISFELEPAGVELRLIPTAAPGLARRSLENLLAERLARDPPRAPVAALELELRPGRVRPVQLSLFLPAGPSPFELAQTLARLEGIVGAGRLFAPRLAEDHRPAAYQVERFDPRGSLKGSPLPSPCGSAGSPPDAGYSQLRALRPPCRIRVRTRPGPAAGTEAAPARPVRLEPSAPWIPAGAEVLRAAGPWRVAGGWWSRRPFSRLYWDVETSAGTLLRLFQDRAGGGWWLDGIHD